MDEKNVIIGFQYAKALYDDLGINVEDAMKKADTIPVSMHCWQGDDLIGFDGIGELTGGIAATGNFFGRARTPDELRKDIDEALKLAPGEKKLNLHACYAEKQNKHVNRDEITIELFQNWVDWAAQRNLGLDFNPTFFSHPMMDGDLSLASPKEDKRKFWVEHGKRCREIGLEFTKRLAKPCIVNYWMPDGYKDNPADTVRLRALMTDSLDEIFEKDFQSTLLKESLESKLFGFGLESYTVVSHEYALGYAITRNKLYCLDAGHFHPTETISSKLSALVPFVKGIMLHVSRGVRWDSDHVVLLDDELQRIMDEIVLNAYEGRVNIGLDYFDASINRIVCWVIGMRNTRKAILSSCLAPIEKARLAERNGDYTARIALMEERKLLPVGAVWDYYCMTRNVPVAEDWLKDVKQYECDVLSKR